MRRGALIEVLAVRALEETDPQRFQLAAERRRDAPGDDIAALAERAARLRAASPPVDALVAIHPWLSGARLATMLIPLGLLGGVLLTGIGEARRINVLDPPLLGLLAWNVLTYSALLARGLLTLASVSTAPMPIRWGLLQFATPLAARAADLRLGADSDLRVGALSRLAALWEAHAPGATRARLAGTLHIAAVTFALGAIAGLYLDGLGTAYRAYWESTFVGAGAVHTFLLALLGPVAALTGISLPDQGGIAAMAEQPIAAGPWIHLWAASLGLWVVAPRAVLAALSVHRAARVEAHAKLDLREPYFQRTLAAVRGVGVAVQVVPYGYVPGVTALERLRARLRADLGPEATLAVQEPQPWDTEPDAIDTDAAERIVVLINPAQTPEEEIHGPLLAALADRAAVTVALDAPAYRTAATRRTARLARWRELLDGLEVEHVTLGAEQEPRAGAIA